VGRGKLLYEMRNKKADVFRELLPLVKQNAKHEGTLL